MRKSGEPLPGLALALLLTAPASGQDAAVRVLDTPLAPKTLIGIGLNGGGSFYNFVGAILVDDPSFEGPPDANGFARDGWPWYSSGAVTATVDTASPFSGVQCQKVTVATAPASINQGRAELPQAPLVMIARPGHTYRIRVRLRSDKNGSRVRLGVLDDAWSGRYGPELSAGTGWTMVESTYQPAAEHLLRGISIRFEDAASYWLDDLVAWDENDIDTQTGLSATFVARLEELAPGALRLGGLGVNGIPLEQYLRHPWDLDYGPPGLQPDLDLNTFLLLCRRVGARPFITVPPAFSDGSHWQVGDLTYEVLEQVYADHGNLVDYIGAESSTPYGARREAAGFPRWDRQFDRIWFELGNELWGTPDDRWDMDIDGDETQAEQMQNFATYNSTRMGEMKSRPGWRENMRLGFCGRSPDIWMGGWPGSYDGTLVPAIGAVTDFSTIDMYYGEGSASDSDEAIYGALFAYAQWHERKIREMKAAFAQANSGSDIPTAVYEGNATWGPYENDLLNPSPLYYKQVSLGAAVSLLDNYAAANRAGVEVIEHFHYGGNIWGATGPYPAVLRKPAFQALKLFSLHLQGDLYDCSVEHAGSWNDTLTGELAVSYLACYPYRQGGQHFILLVNRHRNQALTVNIERRLIFQEAIWLSDDDINANNESDEKVALRSETLAGSLQDRLALTLPAHSAVVVKAIEQQLPEDGGDGGQQEDGRDGGQPLDGGDGGVADGGDAGGRLSGSCACSASGGGFGLIFLLLLLGRRRRQEVRCAGPRNR